MFRKSSESDTLPVMTLGVSPRLNDADLHYRQGMGYPQQNLHAKALDYCDTALRLDPDHAGSLFGMGVVLARLGRWHNALHAYRAAIRVDPENAETYLKLGFLCYALGYDEEAKQACETARRDNPVPRPPLLGNSPCLV